jgi:putative sigma-54 modulation protein
MQVHITFRNLETSDALKQYVQEKIEHVVNKYVDRATESHVVLSLERYLHNADIQIHAGRFYLRGHEKSEDMYKSVDIAMDKIEKQISRYKDRVRDHKSIEHPLAHQLPKVTYRIYSATPESLAELGGPQILEQSEIEARTMTVDEAVMQMDLANNDFLVFQNATSRHMNVVYRRADGNYGLIEAPGK